MAKDEDLRTPEQLDAHAEECLRCAEHARQQGEELLRQGQEWAKLAKDAQALASVRRGDTEQPKRSDPKAAQKRGRR